MYLHEAEGGESSSDDDDDNEGVMKVAAVNALSVMSWLPGLVPVVTVSVLLVAPSVWMPENKISLRKLKGKIVFL